MHSSLVGLLLFLCGRLEANQRLKRLFPSSFLDFSDLFPRGHMTLNSPDASTRTRRYCDALSVSSLIVNLVSITRASLFAA